MRYYEVLVGDLQYHGTSALTYAAEQAVAPGSVVRIALRSRSVLGVVLQEVPEPSFAAKPIAALAPAPPIPTQSLELLHWLYAYYPAPFGTIVRQFLPPSTAFPKRTPKLESISPKQQPHTDALPPLTSEQSTALEAIKPSGYHLLHGITGSGKTRIYIECAARAIASGKSAIILTPEIGLTAQMTASFERTFPGRTMVLHSRLTSAQRRDIWYQLLSSSESVIVIGPRSALFAPVHNVGLIVIDESHDQAYKSETAPHYRTERVAARLAQLHTACLISGSATPNVEEYYIATAKKRPVIAVSRLAVQSDHEAHVAVVDMRDRSLLHRSTILSIPLITALDRALERGEQTLLFLNRRGTAGAILCADCGWQALCKHCDLALTYHGDTHSMICHVCGRSQQLPGACPDCSKPDIVLKTVGTKAVVDEVRRLFPGARIGRFDADTTKAEQLESQLSQLQSGIIDVIIGTQMITKGLDLPSLAVVGVLNADSSLLIPDYSATERTFQLLTQVLGRAGRGHRASTTIIQTYNPEHAIIQAAISRDWQAFYHNELAERQSYGFPPFVHLLKLTCLRATSASAEKAAMKCKEQMQKTHPRLRVEGPSPSFHPRESSKYKWQLIVKSSSRQQLLDIVGKLPSGWSYDIDPVNLL